MCALASRCPNRVILNLLVTAQRGQQACNADGKYQYKNAVADLLRDECAREDCTGQFHNVLAQALGFEIIPSSEPSTKYRNTVKHIRRRILGTVTGDLRAMIKSKFGTVAGASSSR